MATDEKSRLRRATLKRMKEMDAVHRAASSAILRQRLLALLPAGRPLKIGLYVPMPHEVNLMPLLQEAGEHLYAAPRCLSGHRLRFHSLRQPAQDLEEGAHHIPAPKEQLPAWEAEELDVLLVPGVAFCEDGRRLGYGGGYYDRFIPLCHNARIISLAFAEQMQKDIPCEAHDLRIPQLIHL